MDTMEALNQLGLTKHEAKIVIYLKGVEVATQREMDRACDIRQPDVSLALSKLSKKGMVTCVTDPNNKSGRPERKYSLYRHGLMKTLHDQITEQYENNDRAYGIINQYMIS